MIYKEKYFLFVLNMTIMVNYIMVERRKEKYELTVEYYPSGTVHSYTYRQNGVPHCTVGPAITLFDEQTGAVIEECWKLNGKTSRPSVLGPARTRFDPETGIVIQENYVFEGEYSRHDGPSVVDYDRITGKVVNEIYFASLTYGGMLQPEP